MPVASLCLAIGPAAGARVADVGVRHAHMTGEVVRGRADHLARSPAMHDVSSPVPDRLDAGRGELHALQILLALLLGLFLLIL